MLPITKDNILHIKLLREVREEKGWRSVTTIKRVFWWWFKRILIACLQRRDSTELDTLIQTEYHIFYINPCRKYNWGDRYMNLCWNIGVSPTNLTMDLSVNPEPISYNPKGIENILLKEVADRHFLVTYGKKKWFIMERGGGGNHRFLCSYQGLYYLDTKSPTNNMPPTTDKEEKIIEVIEDTTSFFKGAR